jgi:hypothetical protein
MNETATDQYRAAGIWPARPMTPFEPESMQSRGVTTPQAVERGRRLRIERQGIAVGMIPSAFC